MSERSEKPRALLKVKTLAEVPGRLAENWPQRTAITYHRISLTVDQLNSRSNQVANGLRGLVPLDNPGTRVAILDRNADTFFEVLFGVVKTGSVLVTVNFRLTPAEVLYILSDSRTEVLFAGSEFIALIDGVRDQLPLLKTVVELDGGGVYENWRSQQDDSEPELSIDGEDGAVQMYTSGTTGNPKGVELSHRAMVNAAYAGLSVWPFLFRGDSAVLGTMPLFHIAATNLCIASLFAGGRAEILREATPEELADLIPDRGISMVPLPATVIHSMLRLPDIREKDFSTLEVMLVAGSGIATELVREAGEVFQCGFALSYGSTETCGGVTYLLPEECTPDAGDRLHSAGPVLWESEVRITDEDGKELAPGQVGEVVCRCNRLMTGYWRNPEATAEALRDGWFCSGDAGYLDDDGYLYIVDRLKDMVISGGENVYPAEIEDVLHTHPEVEDVAIVGIPDEKWGEALLAFVIPKAGVNPEEIDLADGLQNFLRDKLAGYKIPRRYEYVDEFPRNATGKILKRILRQPYWQDRERNVG